MWYMIVNEAGRVINKGVGGFKHDEAIRMRDSWEQNYPRVGKLSVVPYTNHWMR